MPSRGEPELAPPIDPIAGVVLIPDTAREEGYIRDPHRWLSRCQRPGPHRLTGVLADGSLGHQRLEMPTPATVMFDGSRFGAAHVNSIVGTLLLEVREHPHEDAMSNSPRAIGTRPISVVGDIVDAQRRITPIAALVIVAARPSCFRLLMHCMRRAASRADWTAGNKLRDQHGDDGDDDQQLDEREAAVGRGRSIGKRDSDMMLRPPRDGL